MTFHYWICTYILWVSLSIEIISPLKWLLIIQYVHKYCDHTLITICVCEHSLLDHRVNVLWANLSFGLMWIKFSSSSSLYSKDLYWVLILLLRVQAYCWVLLEVAGKVSSCCAVAFVVLFTCLLTWRKIRIERVLSMATRWSQRSVRGYFLFVISGSRNCRESDCCIGRGGA